MNMSYVTIPMTPHSFLTSLYPEKNMKLERGWVPLKTSALSGAQMVWTVGFSDHTLEAM